MHALPSGDADSDALCLQLSLVKWGRNEKGKIVIERKEALARRGIASPDYADAAILTFLDEPEGLVPSKEFADAFTAASRRRR